MFSIGFLSLGLAFQKQNKNTKPRRRKTHNFLLSLLLQSYKEPMNLNNELNDVSQEKVKEYTIFFNLDQDSLFSEKVYH